MTDPYDQLLAKQVRQGNEDAFVTLIRRYERVLAGLIRSRTGSGDHVQDVLQETLVHVWMGLRRMTPRDVRPWLLQVARNRCRDFFRSSQRRELYVETEVLGPMVNRLGIAQSRQREAADDIVEAMDEVPHRERAALRAFYLEGLSIAEIADRHGCPDGTVKRRLSYGRERIRNVLGITPKIFTPKMRNTDMDTPKQAFPTQMPELRIRPSNEKPFRIDFKEMAWWFIQPEVGDRAAWGLYEPPTEGGEPWKLSETVRMIARRPAVIHGRPCVEVEVEEEMIRANPSREKKSRVWGLLTDDEVEWIAVESLRPDGTRELETFLDERFYEDWDSTPRLVEDRGALRPLGDGVFATQAGAAQINGVGVFDVQIGRRHFTCLRVFEIIKYKQSAERGQIIEAYITRAGRTVLYRRYNGNRRGKHDAPPHNSGEAMTWEEDLPHAARLVVDGVTFVHHYDELTAVACGIA